MEIVSHGEGEEFPEGERRIGRKRDRGRAQTGLMRHRSMSRYVMSVAADRDGLGRRKLIVGGLAWKRPDLSPFALRYL